MEETWAWTWFSWAEGLDLWTQGHSHALASYHTWWQEDIEAWLPYRSIDPVTSNTKYQTEVSPTLWSELKGLCCHTDLMFYVPYIKTCRSVLLLVSTKNVSSPKLHPSAFFFPLLKTGIEFPCAHIQIFKQLIGFHGTWYQLYAIRRHTNTLFSDFTQRNSKLSDTPSVKRKCH